MSIILIIILLGLLLWAIRGIRTEGFMGSSSSDGGASDTIIADSPDFIKYDIPAIQAIVNSIQPNLNDLKNAIIKLDTDISGCSSFGAYRYATHVKNQCKLSRMYINAVSGVLDTATTAGVGTPSDTEAVIAVSRAYLNNKMTYNPVKQDTYGEMVKKFNIFENAITEYLTTVPDTYDFIVPDYDTTKTGLTSPRSYKCVTFNGEEQSILTKLRQRIIGTAVRVKKVSDEVEVNICKSKGWQTGKATFKGCTGCLGCCEPTMDELSVAGPITGTNTITANGTVAGPAEVGTGVGTEAKCPQPKLREYRLNRRPPKFRKVQAPTLAFMECFEDGDASDGEELFVANKPLNLREAARAQKGAKMYGLAENPWIQ
jgi:hypothetical protein